MYPSLYQMVRAIAVVIVFLGIAPSVLAAEFHVDTDAERRVVFVSDAPIESFDGITEKIDGYAVIPADRLADVSDFSQTKFYLEVDLASLDTGIGLRNRDMREDYLHTDEFPYAMYAGSIDSVTSLNDSTFLSYTSGDLTIHGVTKSHTTTDTVTARNGRYHVASHFPVALPNHHIEIPQLMFLKINEVVELDLWFVLKRVDD
ncbi:MAG: hypothetical protein GF341_09170 [candidate division Zixibacteria bacterium]|nr:hypothetical protein [candidate division Zixibacteria bacterium]